jgi:hypothetical protein
LPEKFDVSAFTVEKYLVISKDGSSHAFRNEDTMGTFYIVNGKRTKSYESIITFGLSPDGKHYFFKDKKGQNIRMHTDTYESPPFDYMSGVHYCDNDYFAFTAGIGNSSFLILNGNQIELSYESVDSLQFGDDCNNIIYVGKSENKYVLEKLQL